MAANYWESTQRRFWQFSKQELAELREKLEVEEETLVKAFPLPILRHLSIYFNQREYSHPPVQLQCADEDV
jgi:cyclin-C